MTTLYHDTFLLLLQLICPFLIWTITPSPSPPVSFGLSFIPPLSSLPLLPQLPQCHVTVHVPVLANPDIAEVTRLASFLPIIVHSLLPLTQPQLRLTCDRPTPTGVPFHVRTLVSPTTILSRDTSIWYSHILDLVGSPPDLRISSVTLGPSFGFGHCSDPFGSIRIILGSI